MLQYVVVVVVVVVVDVDVVRTFYAWNKKASTSHLNCEDGIGIPN